MYFGWRTFRGLDEMRFYRWAKEDILVTRWWYYSLFTIVMLNGFLVWIEWIGDWTS